jgi:hypothetical protein
MRCCNILTGSAKAAIVRKAAKHSRESRGVPTPWHAPFKLRIARSTTQRWRTAAKREWDLRSAVLVERKITPSPMWATAASSFCALGFPPFTSSRTTTHWLSNKCSTG